MAGNIIFICGPEYSGKTYMALGLAERLGDFGISQVIFNVGELFRLEMKLLNSEKTTTLVIDEPKKNATYNGKQI